jgi:simple sugar transport system permease protein/D-ribose pyranase
MKRHGLLNEPLSRAIASMGHGDLMIVCDAGFPIPNHVPRIDLAIIKDIPDLETVLSVVSAEFIAEKVAYAAEMQANNRPLMEKVHRIFAGAEFTTFPHQEILSSLASKAKAIVRTGAFDPWGNILLYSGVDVPRWFEKPGTIAPDYYAEKLENQG